jgi:hypothetical protein
MMTFQDIKAAVQSGKPFFLRTTKGEDFSITKPEQINVAPNAPYVIVHDLQSEGSPFRIVFLDTISGLEIVA